MIEVKDIAKSYGNQKILSAINFSIEQGSCVALIGENGSGKTTLLRLLLDMIPPDSGDIIFDQRSIRKAFPINLKKQIGAYLGDDMLIEDLTGKEYLDFIANFYTGNFEQKIKQLLEVFKFDDMNKFEQEKISNYSLGMKRKIALVATLLHEPTYLILDEPFSSLDFKVVNSLLTYLKSIKKDTHIILTTHVLSYINQIADKVILLKDGTIKFHGDTTQLELENIKKITTILDRDIALEQK